jgi:hypothetical protein
MRVISSSESPLEGDLHLGNTAGCGWNADKIEPPERPVVDGHLPLALEHMYGHRSLVIRRSREDLGFRSRYGGIALDDPCHHSTQGLYTE